MILMMRITNIHNLPPIDIPEEPQPIIEWIDENENIITTSLSVPEKLR